MNLDLASYEQEYEALSITIRELAAYGPFAGILITMLEAFFPPFPLVALVTMNVIAYGFVWGYIYSFIGTFIGSYIVYMLISTFGKKKFEHMVHRSNRFDHLLHWIKEKGFVPVFVLLAFPLTPSIIVCGLAGLAGVKRDEYVTALFFGKMLMVLSLSYIGYNVASFFEQPIKSVIMILAIVIISFVGKRLINYYEKRIKARHLKNLQ